MTTTRRDLTRTILAVLCIVGLIATSFWILRPFLPAVIWATMIAVATWPLMLRVQGWLWGRRWLAVTVMTIALLLVFVVPFSLAIGTIVANADEIIGWAQSVAPKGKLWVIFVTSSKRMLVEMFNGTIAF